MDRHAGLSLYDLRLIMLGLTEDERLEVMHPADADAVRLGRLALSIPCGRAQPIHRHLGSAPRCAKPAGHDGAHACDSWTWM